MLDARWLNLIDASIVKPYVFMGACDEWRDKTWRRVH